MPFGRGVPLKNVFWKWLGQIWRQLANCPGSMRLRRDLVAASSDFSVAELENPFEPQEACCSWKHHHRMDFDLPRDLFRRVYISCRNFCRTVSFSAGFRSGCDACLGRSHCRFSAVLVTGIAERTSTIRNFDFAEVSPPARF